MIQRLYDSMKTGKDTLNHLLNQNRLSSVKFYKTCFVFEDWYHMLGEKKESYFNSTAWIFSFSTSKIPNRIGPLFKVFLRSVFSILKGCMIVEQSR